ncbi:helix-turn-helix domain-containing protein [Altererythrobacter arenosus]|uniref:Helix-turn-helix domain-containing protein n=1 Tax=Altererythrobacter arenosus TaxID=3032592 RepID=A0ABY8FZP7_9SPHN|nr:helix-turn-helix domain-containing protein [Altererythrobacter sp. CAU 1644]WFL78801.1 helix-turn-helix domain-containing protein [Altererythrobacter sp. CAU 1644]
MADSTYTDIWRRNLAPLSGTSRDGLPLSENRAPASDIAPWVARLISAKATNDPDMLLACGMCNDMDYTRYVFNGRWTAMTRDGHGTYHNEVLQFGQHARYMPLTVTGDIMSAGFGLRAGAWHALTKRSAVEIVDRIERVDIFGIGHPDFQDVLTDQYTPEQWNIALEEALRRYIKKHDPEPPDPISAAFEMAAFENPTRSLSELAESFNISLRKLERVVKRDFGLTPRLVMRRARALDLASSLCGVVDEDEEQDIILRYFDQSHLIREFASFFGVTPHKFRAEPRPLMTIAMEQRQARRLEELERLEPGERRPWQP